jgi:hypothetical protein
MKRILSISIILFIVFSCSKTNDTGRDIIKIDRSHCADTVYSYSCSGTLCKSDTCVKYNAIWKDQFLSRNQMSPDYFNSHITPCSSRLVNWVDGISYEVTYRVKVDWSEVVVTDRFAIWLSKTTLGLWPTVDVPRNSLLTADQVASLFSLQAFSSSINKINQNNQLKYSSLQAAMSALINAARVDTLCTGSVFYQNPGVAATSAGDPFLEGSGAINWNENKCITCQINLITGETDVFYNACVFTY